MKSNIKNRPSVESRFRFIECKQPIRRGGTEAYEKHRQPRELGVAKLYGYLISDPFFIG